MRVFRRRIVTGGPSGLTGKAPGLVGSLNGIPSATRDTLNRAFLTTEEKRLKEKLAALDKEISKFAMLGGFGIDVKRAAVQSAREHTGSSILRGMFALMPMR